MAVNLGNSKDLTTAVTCQVCGDTFVKVLQGANVCGACQVAMAIVYNHHAELYRKWQVIYLGARR